MNRMIVILALFISALLFQAATTPPPKKAPAEIQARILKLQLQATRIQSQFQACQQSDFQGQYNQVASQMQAAAADALRDAKLDSKEWDLNLDTFEFVKRQQPTAPPAPAPGGKP